MPSNAPDHGVSCALTGHYRNFIAYFLVLADGSEFGCLPDFINDSKLKEETLVHCLSRNVLCLFAVEKRFSTSV
jgi:hypothetical protein